MDYVLANLLQQQENYMHIDRPQFRSIRLKSIGFRAEEWPVYASNLCVCVISQPTILEQPLEQASLELFFNLKFLRNL